jgi:uncharacterized membrane protein
MVEGRRTGGRVQALVLIALMLLPPICTVAAYSQSETQSDNSEIQKWESNWEKAFPSSSFEFELSSSSGLIHTRLGSFDPLEGGKLVAPEELIHSRLEVDRMAIVQLFVNDAGLMEEICSSNGCLVLEPLPDSAWRVRLASNPIESLAKIIDDSKVRWAGPEVAALRLHEGLIEEWYKLPISLDLVALPSPELSAEGLQNLERDLGRLNVEEATCGITLCRIVGMSAIDNEGQKLQLMTLLYDGRILFTEPMNPLRLMNAQASTDIGLSNILLSHNSGLDGSGETFAVLDTGLDSDHPDFSNRILSVRTSFSYDQSGADSNSGHGTHVTGTLISDGGSYSGGRGVVPQSTVHMYALEYDLSGMIAKTGSTYDILRDASIAGARIGVNAWGSSVDLGQYNLESRSLDTFALDYPAFLAVFAVGDDPVQGNSAVAPPSTAKNVLSIGASDGSSVANFSALGPVLDGRIKPDLVAPGVGICSTRAEEASSPAGVACGTGVHANGDPLYMTISGTSPATAVGAASAGLMRQFLRTETGLSGDVTSDLVKAALINGGKDLGSPNIPNPSEGWGQIDLENSMYPMSGTVPLNSWYDNTQELEPGFGFIYTFSLDSSTGIDITLVWLDPSGSSAGSQSTARLVNDLDLQLIAPDGTIWLGNNFASGQSTPGGSKDSINNVERIRLPPGAQTQSGQWSVMISNDGGGKQGFALITTANGSISPSSDLATYADSIQTSQESPLVNDVMTIQLSWVNQASLDSGQYRIIFEDITAGTKLLDTNFSNLEGGKIFAQSIYHTFTTTGQHEMRLSIDSDSEVAEINDEINGVNNNIYNRVVNVSALGLRLVPMQSDGSEPTSPEEISAAAIHEFDVDNVTGMNIPIKLKHEGTSEEVVKLTVTNVQKYDPQQPTRLFSTEDMWTRTIIEGSQFTMPAQGEENDSIILALALEDTSADLTTDPKRFARAGTFVLDLTARYQNQPLVSHSIRLTIIVGKVDAVSIVPAGVGNLQAEPGGIAAFSISVRNTGNTIAQHKLTCSSEHGWPVELGPSQSGTIDFEPLDILEFLPMQVRLRIPPVANGSPLAGEVDMITCTVTSSNDPSFSHSEYANVTVSELKVFSTDLFDLQGNPVGPEASASPITVETGSTVNVSMMITNTGNTEIPLSVKLQSANTGWGMYLLYDGVIEYEKVTFNLLPGQSTTVQVTAFIPLSTSDGSQNAFSLTTRLDEVGTNQFITNGTDFIVGKLLGLNLESSGEKVQATVGSWSQYTLWLNNTGNGALNLNWSTTEAPPGWQFGIDSAPKSIDKLVSNEVDFGVFAPNLTAAGDIGQSIRVRVVGTYYNDSVEVFIDLELEVVPTLHFGIEIGSESKVHDLPRETQGQIEVVITNLGNSPGSGNMSAIIVDGEGVEDSAWSLQYDGSFAELQPGEKISVTISVSPSTDAGSGLRTVEITIQGQAGTGVVVTTLEIISLGVTAEPATSPFDLSGMVSTEVFFSIVVLIPIILFVVVRRMRRNTKIYDDEGESLVAPGVHTSQENIGDRRAAALMEDVAKEDDIISGDISSDEIQAALVQSMADLPPPGPAPLPAALPPLGLPPAGLPPAALPPAALPPKKVPPVESFSASPATTSPQNIAVNIHDSVAQGGVTGTEQRGSEPSPEIMQHGVAVAGMPQVPSTGLPAGWSLEQWRHYGAEWLLRHGGK